MSLRLAVLAAMSFALACPALADDCAAPLSAQLLTAKTPHKLTTTQSGEGAVHTSSLIQTADKIYLQVNGKWRLSPRTPAQAAADVAEAAKTTKYACKATGSEMVSGEAADVYQIHSSNGDQVSDIKVWVSKAKKMTIKTELTAGPTSISNLYDYANVQAPAVN